MCITNEYASSAHLILLAPDSGFSFMDLNAIGIFASPILATGWQRSEATKKVGDTDCGRLRPHLESAALLTRQSGQNACSKCLSFAFLPLQPWFAPAHCKPAEPGRTSAGAIAGKTDEGPCCDSYLACFECCHRSRVQDLLNGRRLHKGVPQGYVGGPKRH